MAKSLQQRFNVSDCLFHWWTTKMQSKYERLNNCKGLHTISAANVGSTRDLVNQKKCIKTINCKTPTARQHCVAKICNASQRAFRDTNRDTLAFLSPETLDVATRVSGRKWVQSTELDIVNGSFCNLCALTLWLALHISATQCWRALIWAVHCCDLAALSIGSCHASVSKRFSRSITLAVYSLNIYFSTKKM